MKKTFFFYLLILFSSYLSAQRYEFKTYKTEEGIVSNETFAIIQDHNNRIWTSTTGGISCFNGSSFKNYTVEDGLASNIAFSLFEDSKGRIWVGTLDNGISIIEDDKITNPKGVDFDQLGSATYILEGRDGTIYIFFINGIVTYKQGKLEYLLEATKENLIKGLQQAAWYDDNTIYIASSKKGIFKLTLSPLKIENLYTDDHSVNDICYSVLVDNKKNIWVGAYGALYKIAQGQLTKYEFKPEDFDKNRIYDILEENEEELFLCFEGNGFGIFNKQTGTLNVINKEQGLPTRYIYKVVKDTEGNHWMTSYGEGIIRFRDTAFKIYDPSQGLPSKSVNAVVAWNDALFLATDSGIVSINKENEIQQITNKVPIKNLLVTQENKLLYTTDEAVIERAITGESTNIIDEGDYNLLYQEQGKTMLFGTNKIKILTKDSTYFINSSRAVAIKPIGKQYILCKISGIFKMDNTKLDTIAGLHPKNHNDFRTLDAINPSEVLAGSEKKLYHISLVKDSFIVKDFDMKRFLPLKHLRALKIDGNDLWMAGKDVITKVDLGLLLKKDSIVATHFDMVDHFLENDIDFNSLLITKDKTLLATSLSGLLAFNEHDFIPNEQPPKLNLSKVLLFSEKLEDSLYKTEDGIVLPSQKNYLSFTMEAITFTNPEKLKYKYRMKGLRTGNEWSSPTQEPTVVFSYLPPGDYTFEFIADNGNGVWQTQPYQFSFIIKVPFWKTWLFWVSLLSFLAISIFSLYYLRNKEKQKRSEAYTHNLIKAQEDERTRLARELHDSVGQKLMLLTKKTKSTGKKDMEDLAINTLEELRAISRGLHPSTLERLGPTLAIQNMVDEIDANTTIFFTHDIDDIDSYLNKETSLHLYRIIQELLNNLVKHAEAKAATVTIKKRKNSIKMVISDNGKGFEVTEKVKTTTSLGMNTMLERAKILKSKIDMKSQINKGSTITLLIPIKDV